MRTVANRYAIMGELGRGAMGVVYRARDQATGREVALKIFQATADAEATGRLARFAREGQVTAALDHPGIVRIHDGGQDGSSAFLVYELVEGARTLHEAFGQRSLAGRVDLVLQTARALGHAHAAGVVHRDVKPENVLVGTDERARLVDFGVARAVGLERLTATGALVGTPSYMAPEQITGRVHEISPASDVWALGVLLYEALTGRVPFEQEHFVHLAAAIAQATPVAPSAVDAAVSPALSAVCRRALAKAPGERFAHGAAFADALADAVAGRAPTGGSGPRLLLAGLVGVALLLAATVGWLATRPAAPAVSESTPPSAQEALPEPHSDEGSRVWRLAQGDQVRSTVSWSCDRHADGYHYRLVLGLSERVTGVADGRALVMARINTFAVNVNQQDTVSWSADSTRGLENGFDMRRLVGRHFSYTLELPTGPVIKVDGIFTASPRRPEHGDADYAATA
ncbi:serine/threonine protein kinase [Planctomycetota bacterium]|nr:serine/threonine protein kinase [Planctomycetota bacterium]